MAAQHIEDVLVAPSILSASFLDLGSDLDDVATADLVHYDVMDGHFVPNLTFGPDILRQVKRRTSLPVDVHLMISNPDEAAALYLEAGADMVSFHLEATAHAHRLVQQIRSYGAKAAVAINPATPVSALECILDDLDMVLVMTVNPGFGGQSFIEGSLRKLRQLRRMMRDHRVSPLVEVDGGVSASNAERIVAAGANVLVAGSAVFNQEDRAATIAAIRENGRRGLVRMA